MPHPVAMNASRQEKRSATVRGVRRTRRMMARTKARETTVWMRRTRS